jgi:hypothetical protein
MKFAQEKEVLQNFREVLEILVCPPKLRVSRPN